MSLQALVVWGGWDGHTPKESAEVAAAMLKDEGFDVRVETSMDVYTDETYMQGLNLVVPIWTMGKIEKEQWQGLRKAVCGGVGLAGFHGGAIDAFRENTDYQWMTGGQWVSHPGGIIPRYAVKITDPDHEITCGLPDFVLPDTEQYYMHVDPSVHVLCTTTFRHADVADADTTALYPDNVVMPYAWTRQYGKGRVFIAAWGHTWKDFDEPTAREILRRGMCWAAR